MSGSAGFKGTLARIWGNKWLRYVGIIFILLTALLVMASLSVPRAKEGGKAPKADPASGDAGRFDDAVPSALEIRAFANSFSSEIGAQRERVSKLGAQVEALDKRVVELHALNRQLVEVVQLLQQEVGSGRRSGTDKGDPRPLGDISDGGGETSEPSRLRILLVDPNVEAKDPGDTKRLVRIPAGSFAFCTLLTGIYAPTTGEPLPVLLRVDQLAIGPNTSRVPIRGAFLVGKAQGDANSRRAIVQLVALSLVLQDGMAIEVPVNGYIADDVDGVQGARGEYVYRIGEIAGHASLAAGLEGLSETFRSINGTRVVNPLGAVTDTVDPKNAAKVVGVSSASKALSRLSEVFTKRLDEVVPAIHVVNGGRVTAVFLRSVTLEGFELEQIHEQGQKGKSPHVGLDAHR